MKQILIILMINRESCSMTASPATLASGMSNNIGIFLCYLGDVILVIIRYDQQHWYIFLLSWWRDTRDNLVGQLLGMALFIISEKNNILFWCLQASETPALKLGESHSHHFRLFFCLQAAPAMCIFGRYEGVGKFGHFGNMQNLGHSQFKLSCTSLFFQ